MKNFSEDIKKRNEEIIKASIWNNIEPTDLFKAEQIDTVQGDILSNIKKYPVDSKVYLNGVQHTITKHDNKRGHYTHTLDYFGNTHTHSTQKLHDIFKAIDVNGLEGQLFDKLQKGIINNELFQDAMHELEIIKGTDPTNGGQLVPKHIVDKNGKRTIVYVSKDALLPEHHDIKAGDKFKTKDGKIHTVVKDKGHADIKGKSSGHLITLQDETGRKHDKFIHNLEPHHEESKKESDPDSHPFKNGETYQIVKNGKSFPVKISTDDISGDIHYSSHANGQSISGTVNHKNFNKMLVTPLKYSEQGEKPRSDDELNEKVISDSGYNTPEGLEKLKKTIKNSEAAIKQLRAYSSKKNINADDDIKMHEDALKGYNELLNHIIKQKEKDSIPTSNHGMELANQISDLFASKFSKSVSIKSNTGSMKPYLTIRPKAGQEGAGEFNESQLQFFRKFLTGIKPKIITSQDINIPAEGNTKEIEKSKQPIKSSGFQIGDPVKFTSPIGDQQAIFIEDAPGGVLVRTRKGEATIKHENILNLKGAENKEEKSTTNPKDIVFEQAGDHDHWDRKPDGELRQYQKDFLLPMLRDALSKKYSINGKVRVYTSRGSMHEDIISFRTTSGERKQINIKIGTNLGQNGSTHVARADIGDKSINYTVYHHNKDGVVGKYKEVEDEIKKIGSKDATLFYNYNKGVMKHLLEEIIKKDKG
jgi:hypothetical protein